ncbi:MAG: DUF2799 domain-containing protein [Gammaproteobacteria bacterium]|nr:DUF2799 domain-containing protein [Gammaproteobacteria bacterium]
MNKSECLTADWRTIGFGDGANGHTASRISQHRSACAEHGITPDLNAYNAGRSQGLSQYCIPSKGYHKGMSGVSYNGVCSGHNEKDFLDAYNFGYAIYKEEKILSNMKSDYSREQHRISSLERSLQYKEQQIISGKLSKVKALMLLNETKQMAEELGKAKSNLNNIAASIQDQEGRIASIRSERNYN